jgi:hypothetical protein
LNDKSYFNLRKKYHARAFPKKELTAPLERETINFKNIY